MDVNRFSNDSLWVFVGHFLNVHATVSGSNDDWALGNCTIR